MNVAFRFYAFMVIGRSVHRIDLGSRVVNGPIHCLRRFLCNTITFFRCHSDYRYAFTKRAPALRWFSSLFCQLFQVVIWQRLTVNTSALHVLHIWYTLYSYQTIAVKSRFQEAYCLYIKQCWVYISWLLYWHIFYCRCTILYLISIRVKILL